MGKQDPPHGARPLDETYERIRRRAEAHGKDAEQAKREAAAAVHQERGDEAASDDRRVPDEDGPSR